MHTHCVCTDIMSILIHYNLNLFLYLCQHIQGSINKFPDFFRMGTFIDSTHMKL